MYTLFVYKIKKSHPRQPTWFEYYFRFESLAVAREHRKKYEYENESYIYYTRLISDLDPERNLD